MPPRNGDPWRSLTMPSNSQQTAPHEKARGFHVTSASTGAFEFLPIPFLDEWLIKRQRLSMVEEILTKRGINFDEEVPGILVGGGKTLLSRIGSMSRGLVLKPLRKMFRSVFFWLTARSAARTAMVTYFLARFLHHPGLVPQDAGKSLTVERARYLAETFREVSKGIDLRAVRETFRQLVGLFARRKEISGSEVSQTIEKSAPGFIAEFDSAIWGKLVKDVRPEVVG